MLKSFIKKIPGAVSYYENKVVPKKRYNDFKKDFDAFTKLASKEKRFSVLWKDIVPCLEDKTADTSFEPHYTYHPAWAARILAKTNPKLHVDISSTLYFSAMISAFLPVEFYDYRPANLKLSGLSSGSMDLTSLPFPSNSVQSLSCMHVVEHIGLGRYGDPIDPDGDLKAISELKRVVAKGGNLIFVTPIGKPKIVFNAHRIYSYKQIIKLFSKFTLTEYVLIPDNAFETGMIINATEEQTNNQNWGCGCFWFTKK